MLTADERAKAEVMRELRRRQAVIDADPNLVGAGQAGRARPGSNSTPKRPTLAQLRLSSTRAGHPRRSPGRAFGIGTAPRTDVLADRDARQYAAGLTTPGEARRLPRPPPRRP